MKVLFFIYDFPYPTTSGGKTRAFNLLKYGGKNVDFYLFSFVRESINQDRIEKIREIGVKSEKLFKRKKLLDPKNILSLANPTSSIFRQLYFDQPVLSAMIQTIKDEKIDVVLFESFYTAFYLRDELLETGVKTVFGTENIEYKLYEDYARHIAPFPMKPFYFWEARKIKKEEIIFYKEADVSLAVLQAEADLIGSYSKKPAYVIPNGVDVDFFAFKPKKIGKKKNILFIGNFSYFPNVDAVKFFYESVFNKLADENVNFLVVGKNASSLSFLKSKNVQVRDYLEDIRVAYYDADIFVSPVRIGGGTNFKVLEAMATGVPVVAFFDRVKGLEAVHEKHLLTAGADSFKDEVMRLLTDEKLKTRIIRNARELIEEKYDWRVIGKKLNEVLISL